MRINAVRKHAKFHLPVDWGVVAITLRQGSIPVSVVATTAPIITRHPAISCHAIWNAAGNAQAGKGVFGSLNALLFSVLLLLIQDS